ncbi:MAG: hypothetical protein OEM82_14455 [Acidobacteriota bacterium]|nr:hypothetical protein [Acidobacteriota bacterium]MDH3528574.1 hypothetical protein [Acidobacteriota bacterium]
MLDPADEEYVLKSQTGVRTSSAVNKVLTNGPEIAINDADGLNSE